MLMSVAHGCHSRLVSYPEDCALHPDVLREERKDGRWWLTQNGDSVCLSVVVVVVIAQQLVSYRQLSRLRKSATLAGLSHRSCTASCV